MPATPQRMAALYFGLSRNVSTSNEAPAYLTYTAESVRQGRTSRDKAETVRGCGQASPCGSAEFVTMVHEAPA
jgi:hypothetical protein